MEAKETGRRQAEMIIKKREEKLYAEIIEMNRQFAEDLLDQTVDNSSAFLTKKLALGDTKLRDQKFQEYLRVNDE